MKQVILTDAEHAVLAVFLDVLSEQYQNTGCNELELENTPENMEMIPCRPNEQGEWVPC